MPTGGCARLAVGVWLLIGLILGTVYRSNLKALLIIPKLELPFDSMEDLIKSGITTAVVAGTSVHMDVVSANSDSILGKLREKVLVYPADSLDRVVSRTVMGLHTAFGPELAIEQGDGEVAPHGVKRTYLFELADTHDAADEAESVTGDLISADAEVQPFDETCDAKLPEFPEIARFPILGRYEVRSLQSKAALHQVSGVKW
ncbi:hypothetical protein O3P69_014880 [Scylla paramamosain]|uniref:Ionotropic glutamate receptor C-terminal domain-containing protein n=1 Tax=Scylla paramamosain TaxID=85552 RepID=A0AAW0U1H8_SCYPA